MVKFLYPNVWTDALISILVLNLWTTLSFGSNNHCDCPQPDLDHEALQKRSLPFTLHAFIKSFIPCYHSKREKKIFLMYHWLATTLPRWPEAVLLMWLTVPWIGSSQSYWHQIPVGPKSARRLSNISICHLSPKIPFPPGPKKAVCNGISNKIKCWTGILIHIKTLCNM